MMHASAARAAASALLAAALLATAGVPAAEAANRPRNHTPPPTSRQLPPRLPAPRVRWQSIGTSVRGRAILAARFGSGRRRVLYLGGLHGDEYGADVAEAFAAFLAAHPAAIPVGTEIDVVGCANPDGRAAGTRGNARGVDVNRNFPSRNWRPLSDDGCSSGARPASEPETRVLIAELGRGYARVISLHSQGGVVDYDGPGSRAIADRVSAASGMPVVDLGVRPGSMGAFVPERFGIPIVTVELVSRSLTRPVLGGLVVAAR
jgi:murein peptide amidase A